MRIIILLLINGISLISAIYAQDMKSQEAKDWTYFVANKSKLCQTIEECDTLDRLNLLEYSKFIDDVYTKRSQMAVSFLDKYPHSVHYDDVLDHYLHLYFQPLFISESIDDSHLDYLNKFSGPVRTGPEVTEFYRTLPIDKQAMEQWVNKGNALVTKVLTSNASLHRKADVETRLLSRDYNIAKRWYDALPKASKESDYWMHFDKQYWNFMKQRLFNLLDKYPNYEPLARYIQSLLLGSLKYRSPELAESYMKQFLIKTNKGNHLADSSGVKALHDKLKAHVRTKKTLIVTGDSKPVEMTFTAIDGTKIDLTKMRGKVVLIDFWSIRCGPCLKEMPHVAEMFKKYRSMGFEVIGVAAGGDEVKERVLQIINKKQAKWPQHLDKGKNATLSYHDLYDINALPTVWLLDKSGNIVDRDARGARLEPLIRKYLGLEK